MIQLNTNKTNKQKLGNHKKHAQNLQICKNKTTPTLNRNHNQYLKPTHNTHKHKNKCKTPTKEPNTSRPRHPVPPQHWLRGASLHGALWAVRRWHKARGARANGADRDVLPAAVGLWFGVWMILEILAIS